MVDVLVFVAHLPTMAAEVDCAVCFINGSSRVNLGGMFKDMILSTFKTYIKKLFWKKSMLSLSEINESLKNKQAFSTLSQRATRD